MSSDQALALMAKLLEATMYLAGPILMASLIAGIFVGIVQTATQVNEASVSYVVKVLAVISVIAVLGPKLSANMLTYTRECLQSIEHVVH